MFGEVMLGEGVPIGRYYVRWLCRNVNRREDCASAVRKMDGTPGLIVVEVHRFDIPDGCPRYAVRLPNHAGWFRLSDFEWHGNYRT